MHALKQNGFHNALQLALAAGDNIQILRTDDNINHLVFTEAVIHAVKASAAEHNLVIIHHHTFNDIGFADEVRNKFIDRLVINISRAANLLNFALSHDNDFIGHGQRFLLIMRHINKGNADLLLNFFQLLLHFLSEL